MASVDSVTVDGFTGRLFTAGLRSTDLQPSPGYDGSVIVFGGTGGEDAECQTILRDSLVNLQAQALLWEALEGSATTVVDGAGVSWAGVLVRRCRNAISQDALGYHMRTAWTFRVGV